MAQDQKTLPAAKNVPAKNELAEFLRDPVRMKEIRMALGKGADADRFVRGVLTTIAQDPKLSNATPGSIYKAMLTSAALGLEVDPRGHAYLVPFNTDGGVALTLIPGYKGYIYKTRQAAGVRAVFIEAVHDGDDFQVVKGLAPTIRHVPALGTNYGVDEKITHFYAAVKMDNGETEFEVMTRSQVEAVRDGLRYKSPIWEKHFQEMGRKTVFRRLTKRLQFSEISKLNAYDEALDGGRAAYVGRDGIEQGARMHEIEMTPEEDADIQAAIQKKIQELKKADPKKWTDAKLRGYMVGMFGSAEWGKLRQRDKYDFRDYLESQA